MDERTIRRTLRRADGRMHPRMEMRGRKNEAVISQRQMKMRTFNTNLERIMVRD